MPDDNAASPKPAPGLVARLRSCWPLVVLIGIYFLVRSFYWDAIPIWDGAVYAEALFKANQQPFDLSNFSAGGHICHGFFLVLSIAGHWFKDNYRFFNVWLTVFGVMGVVAFYRLLTFFFAGRIQSFELAIATALMAFHPSILASMIHFNTDIGVLTFLLWYWLFLLEERKWLAVVAGILTALSKETGFPLQLALFVLCLSRQPSGSRKAWLGRNWRAGAVPGCAFGMMMINNSFDTGSLFYEASNTPGPFEILFYAITPDSVAKNYGGLLFVLNFNWLLLLSGIILLSVVILKRRKPKIAPKIEMLQVIVLAFVASAALAFIVRGYSNVRYLIVPIVFMILGVVYMLFICASSRGVRWSVLLGLLAIFIAEDFRTVDPLSRKFFGTFKFGKHEMLHVTRLTGELAGYGRDQLVYNLEFLKFSQMTSEIVEDLDPATNTFIFFAPPANWHLLPSLDPATHKVVFCGEHSYAPNYCHFGNPRDASFRVKGLDFADIQKPKELYYIEFPNMQNEGFVESLNRIYAHVTDKVYDRDGYQMTVLHFSN